MFQRVIPQINPRITYQTKNNLSAASALFETGNRDSASSRRNPHYVLENSGKQNLRVQSQIGRENSRAVNRLFPAADLLEKHQRTGRWRDYFELN